MPEAQVRPGGLRIQISAHFLEEFYMSEVSPYRDDHSDYVEGENCHGCDDVHGPDDRWGQTVTIIEKAYETAERKKMERHVRHAGEADKYGWHSCTTCAAMTGIRIPVHFPAETLATLDDMLDNDVDKWHTWVNTEFDAWNYVNVGNNIREKIYEVTA